MKFKALISSFKGIIFDFNGVLWWDSHLQVQAWQQFSTEIRGWPFSAEEIDVHVHGRHNRYTLEYLTGRTIEGFELQQLAQQKETIYRRLCLDEGENFKLSPGAIELLDFLTAHHICRTIATASEKTNLDFFVKHFHLDQWFKIEQIVYDDGTRPGKPAPDIYLQAARNLGLKPSNCVVVEDSRSGIRAAHTAGIGHIIALGPVPTHRQLAQLEGVNIAGGWIFPLSLPRRSVVTANTECSRTLYVPHVSRRRASKASFQRRALERGTSRRRASKASFQLAWKQASIGTRGCERLRKVEATMSHILRIGSAIDPVDPYWVQVREAAYERAEQLPLDLISISLVDYPETLPAEKQMALLEELLALELDALIAWSLPDDLAYNILQFGLPLILLSETEARHPLLISPLGLYDIAQIGSNHLVEKLSGRGNVLALGGLIQANWRDESTSWIAGIRDVFQDHPHLNLKHIPTPRVYEQAYPEIYKAMQRIGEPIEAIFGLSDTVALIGREAGQELSLLDQHTLIVGIGGTPSALAEITDGNMTATVDILTDELGKQAVDLACQAAQGQPLPAHFDYKSRLVTAQNVAEVAAQKLVAIANLPNRLVGVRRRQQQERLKQLETSLEISRRVGSILDHRQLSHEIANLIRANFGYDRVQIFHWVEDEQLLVLDQPEQAQASPVSIPVTGSGVLGQALMHNEPIFIPDTRRSPRFAPDPRWPNTRTRVVLPIRLGDKVLGLLDLHSDQSTLRARQELVGLQSLADQLGIAMSNADLYGEALKARAEAEKADQLKTRLLANVSHELRTPLNTILGYMKTALDSSNTYNADLPVVILNDLQHVFHSAEHLLHVINDLLDLSRAEIGELALSPEMMDPRPFLAEVFHSIADSAVSQSGINWRLQLPDRLPTIQADPVRLRQILLNLLSNACKFTDMGEIVLGAEVTPPHLHVWVQDTGSGIPVEQQERIFEPFTTAEHVSRRREGIGLGLSITRQLVALHRGSMTLESQPEQGSTFHIYLPLPSLSDQPAPLPLTSAQPVLLLISAQEQPAREIVDLSHCQGLELRRLQADDNVEAMLRGLQPAALAWDLTSANANDWIVVQRLRNHPQLCHVPFILYGQNQGDKPGMTLGMTHLVTKPVNAKTLIEAISALCPPESVGPILIVDDDPQACELYRGMVAKGLPGYPIRTASDGTTALAAMAEAPPSLVILDLMMPEMDGFEVLDWMRTNQQTQQVPVLILSGRMLTLEDIKRLERHTRATFQSKDILSEAETTAVLHQILFDTDTLPPHTSALVKRAVAYFQQNYNHQLSREEIAKAIGVSKNYLSHIFRQELGLSPWDYLNRYRIKQAKDLLSHTSDSVTEVALQVGFNNPAYFSRMFHKQIGLSPSAYRENAK